jgi:hypothetical protein
MPGKYFVTWTHTPVLLFHFILFYLIIFETGSHYFCLGWPQTWDPSASTSAVAEIIDVYHHIWSQLYFLCFLSMQPPALWDVLFSDETPARTTATGL